jgi:hypothetical protein
MSAKDSKEKLAKLLSDLGLDLGGLSFLERDCLYRTEGAAAHEVDRTPVIFDPDLGPGDGVRARCFDIQSLDLGGQATTDGAGRLTWKLSNFVCSTQGISYLAPSAFVATAMSSSPVFITTRTLSTGSDLVIDVFSWDTDGAPAPNVRFAWRCWVQSQAIVL